MTTMTQADADAVWGAIDDQRTRTADLLEQLTAEQWDHPSLCQGWTVRHVAAHLTMQQQRVRDAAAFIARNPRILRSRTLNATIHDSAVLQAQALPSQEIISRIRAMTGSRRHNAFVTPLETLTDILVHSQDVAIPLGLHLTMRPTASAIAATRRWDTRGTWLAKVFRRLPLDGYRLTATDTDWTRGQGPEVAGPVGALLLLLTGRSAALEQLTGEGAADLRSALSTSV
ncbi:MAG TPA: maleylpyruvate isomerase family mycothiol-dependent enzyme [Intrasporangium sp.]|uniref:maleylpyruvate isomerase family mycothiol-dependent enzyme n=1 Tax=Intrasporangium sp. TaxID=1925024 RepID=UPI002D76AFF2|nr:maleylpyruvate isomerase family mycothiol-dependent enzyme [Intrasporangium sp.]HET7399363.1 maleylpyruvate isomerase family mycothiol-dependent enzyme [Intrasporangium sp.]